MTAAVIAASSMASLGGITLNLNAHTISDVGGGAGATAGITFGSNGQVSFIGSSTPTSPDLDEWVKEQTGFADGADYEVAYTALVSGTAPDAGAGLGTYQALSSSRTWSFSASGVLKDGVWRFRVREIADTSNFVEADMTMQADDLP